MEALLLDEPCEVDTSKREEEEEEEEECLNNVLLCSACTD
jgi:hypothetical protein